MVGIGLVSTAGTVCVRERGSMSGVRVGHVLDLWEQWKIMEIWRLLLQLQGGLSADVPVLFLLPYLLQYIIAPQGDALQQGTEVSGYVVLP